MRRKGAGKGAAALVPVSAHRDPEREQRSVFGDDLAIPNKQ